VIVERRRNEQHIGEGVTVIIIEMDRAAFARPCIVGPGWLGLARMQELERMTSMERLYYHVA
jgi:hypothetical protein